jgi:serine/threonine-protein kinase
LVLGSPSIHGRTCPFRREIQIAAGLQHPCIVPVLTAGLMEDTPFYTMPFVDGESLRARLDREGKLGLTEALSLLAPILSAVAAAHAEGIVHRDLKPENVLLSSGYALVTDFGVAKALAAGGGGRDHMDVAPGAELTVAGMTVGTPAYMAPEQATADPAADYRVDVYSLGVMAYELLAGQRPFAARTAQEMLVAHITRAPTPIDARRPDLPGALAQLVMSCLAKAPGDRPDARAVVDALDRAVTPVGTATQSRAPQTVTSAPFASLPSIAVLPFVNVAGDADTEHLADGIAEEILNALARLRTVHVAARSSSFAFRGPTVDLRAVGRQLDVGTVLEGRVRRSGQRLRVTVQLVDVTSGFQLWADRFDRELADVFEIEDEIAGSIVDTLKVTLLQSPGAPLAPRRTTSVEAYELYLRGRYHWYQVGGGIERALELFERALAIDPDFALAHAGVADVFITAAIFETMPPAEAFPLARVAAERAHALDPSLAEPHAALGAICLLNDWDFPRARVLLERAVALNPSNVNAYTWLTLYHTFLGDTDTALSWARRGIQVDPLAAPASYSELYALYTAQRFDEAVECARRVLELNPAYSEGYRCLGASLLALGQPGPALDALRQAVALGGSSAWSTAGLAVAHAQLGNREEAERLLAELLRRSSEDEWVSPLTLAVVHAALGNTGEAIACIERSLEARDCWMVSLAVDPAWVALRGNPRFEALVAKVGIGAAPPPGTPPSPMTGRGVPA